MRRTYAAAIFFMLTTAGAAFAQAPSPMRTPGDNCMPTDYGCNPQPKSMGSGNTGSTDPNDANAARLRSELSSPASSSSNEPEEPEQPVDQPIAPEGPITK